MPWVCYVYVVYALCLCHGSVICLLWVRYESQSAAVGLWARLRQICHGRAKRPRNASCECMGVPCARATGVLWACYWSTVGGPWVCRGSALGLPQMHVTGMRWVCHGSAMVLPWARLLSAAGRAWFCSGFSAGPPRVRPGLL